MKNFIFVVKTTTDSEAPKTCYWVSQFQGHTPLIYCPDNLITPTVTCVFVRLVVYHSSWFVCLVIFFPSGRIFNVSFGDLLCFIPLMLQHSGIFQRCLIHFVNKWVRFDLFGCKSTLRLMQIIFLWKSTAVLLPCREISLHNILSSCCRRYLRSPHIVGISMFYYIIRKAYDTTAIFVLRFTSFHQLIFPLTRCRYYNVMLNTVAV